jgi:opacity protein-like surface antigen
MRIIRTMTVASAFLVLAAAATARAQAEGQPHVAPIQAYAPQPAALPAAAPPAALPEATAASTEAEVPLNHGWNATWSLLFELNNIFTNQGILGAYSSVLGRGVDPNAPVRNVGIGATYFMQPDTALRASIGLGRTTTPRTVTKSVLSTGGQDDITTYAMAGTGATATTNFGLNADLLRRLLSGRVAPYVGAGLYVAYGQTNVDFKDDVSVVDQVTTEHDYTRTLGIGVRGLVGAEWRLHPSFALFAEYQIGVEVFNHSVNKNDKLVENTNVPSATRTQSESSTPAWLGARTDIAHGAQFGLSVLF